MIKKNISPKKRRELADALNLIDDQAEEAGCSIEESVARGLAYNKLMDFIYGKQTKKTI